MRPTPPPRRNRVDPARDKKIAEIRETFEFFDRDNNGLIYFNGLSRQFGGYSYR